mgnify:CR=1 FL=1
MRQKIYVLGILFLFCAQLRAQKEFTNWYFGDNAGLVFEENFSTYLIDGQTNGAINPATISDKDGNLLFYFGNGIVFDKSHNVMLNGNDILSRAINTGTIIIPKPNSSGLYYLIT